MVLEECQNILRLAPQLLSGFRKFLEDPLQDYPDYGVFLREQTCRRPSKGRNNQIHIQNS